MLKITLVKSPIGYKPKAKLTIAALGLKKLNHFVIKSPSNGFVEIVKPKYQSHIGSYEDID